MNGALLFEMLPRVAGGLGIFLLGMKNMSEGMQAVAGSRLRRLIGAVTNNRFMACAIGIAVTATIQSSSVTTVMVVGFVNAGLMTLMQAIGVILGANIGTTVTAWILVLKVGAYGLPVLGLAAFFYLFGKGERLRYSAMTVMGIGMIFFGLELMKDGFAPLRDMPEFVEWFHRFTPGSLFGVVKCALVGSIVTAIVQSSSATIGITIGLASTGAIGFETAAALVLGQNIGTTVTALLASLGATTNARRAAYAHTIFNVVGVLVVIPVFPLYVRAVRFAIGAPAAWGAPLDDITQGIAMAHTGFNVANTIVFLPLMGALARLVKLIARDKPHREEPHLTFLDVRMLDTPAIGIQQSYCEVQRMGEAVLKMMRYLREILTSAETDEAKEKKVFHREEVLDIMQKEIVEFLSNLLAGSVPHDVLDKGRMQIRMADEFESISDYIVNVLKMKLRLRNAGLDICTEGREECLSLHDHVAEVVTLVHQGVMDNHPEVISKVRTRGDAVTHMVRDYRERHLARFQDERTSPLASLAYTDMLNAYRRIKDHALNIAEALAGEK
ncbi:MAG: Na/Pi cotransporter family protein [Kiritimatiellae bacterium]|nr:Na/Pi cotransporter family protein [Kiritimatiellia bacterium]